MKKTIALLCTLLSPFLYAVPPTPNNVDVQINWNEKVSVVHPAVWGTNIYSAPANSFFTSQIFKDYMQETNFHFIRRFNAGWVKLFSPQKDVFATDEKIRKNAVQLLKKEFHWLKSVEPTQYKRSLCFTIYRPPTWILPKGSKEVTDDTALKFGKFMKEIAVFFNNNADEIGIGDWDIYWELLNEFDRGCTEELMKLYVAGGKAVKEVNPDYKIAGPVVCYPYLDTIRDYILYLKEHAPELLDCISWHKYATGSTKVSTETVLALTKGFGNDVRSIRDLVRTLVPGKEVKLMISELNVNYDYTQGDPRNWNYEGVAFAASALINMIEADIDFAANWHLELGSYAMITGQKVRPTGVFYKYANKYLVGDAYKVKTDRTNIDVLAVKGKRGKSILIVNKKPVQQKVSLGYVPDTLQGILIDENGIRSMHFSENGIIRLSLSPFATLILWETNE